MAFVVVSFRWFFWECVGSSQFFDWTSLGCKRNDLRRYREITMMKMMVNRIKQHTVECEKSETCVVMKSRETRIFVDKKLDVNKIWHFLFPKFPKLTNKTKTTKSFILNVWSLISLELWQKEENLGEFLLLVGYYSWIWFSLQIFELRSFSQFLEEIWTKLLSLHLFCLQNSCCLKNVDLSWFFFVGSVHFEVLCLIGLWFLEFECGVVDFGYIVFGNSLHDENLLLWVIKR